MNKISVLLLVFNRKDNALKMFESVREYRPERLYIAADGPRAHKQGETQACQDTRQALLDAIDWPCEVRTLFRKENLGCAKAVYGAISWFFENEEWGIIIEDDIILHQDFYKMCEELLPMYANDDRIQQITSQFYGKHVECANTYTFQRKPYIWGWATWRRSWQKYMDMDMKLYPSFRFYRLIPIYGLFQTIMMYHYWNRTWKNLETSTSWATRWHFAAVVNELLSICPKTNLGVNIGCTGQGGTHYGAGSVDPYSRMKLGSLSFPLIHPMPIELDMQQVAIDNADFKRIKTIGAKQKIKKSYIFLKEKN